MAYQCVWHYGSGPCDAATFDNSGKGYPSVSKALWHGQRERGRLMRRQDKDAAEHPERVNGRRYQMGTLTVEPLTE